MHSDYVNYSSGPAPPPSAGGVLHAPSVLAARPVMFQSGFQSFSSSPNNSSIPSRHPLNLSVAEQSEMISLASPPQPQLPITLMQSNNSSPSSPTAPTALGPHPFQDSIFHSHTSRVPTALTQHVASHPTQLQTITESFTHSQLAAPVPRSPGRQSRPPRIVWSTERYSADKLLQVFKCPILVNTMLSLTPNNNNNHNQQHDHFAVTSAPQNGNSAASNSTSTAELTLVLLGSITASRFELTTDLKRLPSNSGCESAISAGAQSARSAHSGTSTHSTHTPDSNCSLSPRPRLQLQGRNLEPPIFSTAETTMHLTASTDCPAPVRLVNELTESFGSVAELALHFPRYVQLLRRLELPTRTATVAVPGQRLELLKTDKKLSQGVVSDFLVVRYGQREVALPFDMHISCVPVPDPNSYTLYDIYRRFPLPQHFLFINPLNDPNNNSVHNSRETNSTNTNQESELEISSEVLRVVTSLQQNRVNESHSDVSPATPSGAAISQLSQLSQMSQLESTPPPPTLFADTLRRQPNADANARVPLAQSPLAHASFELERRFDQRFLVGLVADASASATAGTPSPSSTSASASASMSGSSAHLNEDLNALLLWHQNPSGLRALRVVFIPLADASEERERERDRSRAAREESYARQLSTFSADSIRLSFAVALRRSAARTLRSVSGSHSHYHVDPQLAAAAAPGGGSLTIADFALNGSNYAPLARLTESIDMDKFATLAQMIDLLPQTQSPNLNLNLNLHSLPLSKPESAQAVFAATGLRIYSLAEVYGREASAAPPTLIDSNANRLAVCADALKLVDVTCDGLPVRRSSTGSNSAGGMENLSANRVAPLKCCNHVQNPHISSSPDLANYVCGALSSSSLDAHLVAGCDHCMCAAHLQHSPTCRVAAASGGLSLPPEQTSYLSSAHYCVYCSGTDLHRPQAGAGASRSDAYALEPSHYSSPIQLQPPPTTDSRRNKSTSLPQGAKPPAQQQSKPSFLRRLFSSRSSLRMERLSDSRERLENANARTSSSATASPTTSRKNSKSSASSSSNKKASKSGSVSSVRVSPAHSQRMALSLYDSTPSIYGNLAQVAAAGWGRESGEEHKSRSSKDKSLRAKDRAQSARTLSAASPQDRSASVLALHTRGASQAQLGPMGAQTHSLMHLPGSALSPRCSCVLLSNPMLNVQGAGSSVELLQAHQLAASGSGCTCQRVCAHHNLLLNQLSSNSNLQRSPNEGIYYAHGDIYAQPRLLRLGELGARQSSPHITLYGQPSSGHYAAAASAGAAIVNSSGAHKAPSVIVGELTDSPSQQRRLASRQAAPITALTPSVQSAQWPATSIAASAATAQYPNPTSWENPRNSVTRFASASAEAVDAPPAEQQLAQMGARLRVSSARDSESGALPAVPAASQRTQSTELEIGPQSASGQPLALSQRTSTSSSNTRGDVQRVGAAGVGVGHAAQQAVSMSMDLPVRPTGPNASGQAGETSASAADLRSPSSYNGPDDLNSGSVFFADESPDGEQGLRSNSNSKSGADEFNKMRFREQRAALIGTAAQLSAEASSSATASNSNSNCVQPDLLQPQQRAVNASTAVAVGVRATGSADLKSLSVSDLAQLLRSLHLDRVASVCEDHCVDGAFFSDLTPSDLRAPPFLCPPDSFDLRLLTRLQRGIFPKID